MAFAGELEDLEVRLPRLAGGPSRALESCLVAFGSVVAWRAACIARVGFAKDASGRVSRGEKDLRVRWPSPYELARNWRLTECVDEYPSSPMDMAAVGRSELDLVPFDQKQLAAGAKEGRPWDHKGTLHGYETIAREFNRRVRIGTPQEQYGVRLTLQGLITWIWAVPFYADIVTSVESWCEHEADRLNERRPVSQRKSRSGVEEEAAMMAGEREEELARWYIRASRFIDGRVRAPGREASVPREVALVVDGHVVGSRSVAIRPDRVRAVRRTIVTPDGRKVVVGARPVEAGREYRPAPWWLFAKIMEWC
jgi:hypothetical protein